MNFKYITPIDEMERISRKDVGENLDEILERIEKENVGFVITDEGRDDIVMIPAHWFSFSVDDDFGCVINSAVRYAIGRHTYMPGVVCNFVRRYMEFLDTRTINIIIEDINRELQFNIEQEELWIKLRDDLIVRYNKMMSVEKNDE